MKKYDFGKLFLFGGIFLLTVAFVFGTLDSFQERSWGEEYQIVQQSK